MRILLDECLPKKLKAEFSDHTVFTVQEKGWAGMKNGELLRSEASHFSTFQGLSGIRSTQPMMLIFSPSQSLVGGGSEPGFHGLLGCKRVILILNAMGWICILLWFNRQSTSKCLNNSVERIDARCCPVR